MIVVAKHPHIRQAKPQARNDRNPLDPALSSEEVKAAFSLAHTIKSLLPSKRKVTFHASPFLSCVQTAACFAKVFSRQYSQIPLVDLYLHNALSGQYTPITESEPMLPPKALASVIPLLQINNLSRENFKQLYIGTSTKLSLNIHYNSFLHQPALHQSASDRRSRLMRSFAATIHGAGSIKSDEIVIVISHDTTLQTFREIFEQSSEPSRTSDSEFAIAKIFKQKWSPETQSDQVHDGHQRIKIKEDLNYTEQKVTQDLELIHNFKGKVFRRALAKSQQISYLEQRLFKTFAAKPREQQSQIEAKGHHTLNIKLLRDIKNQSASGSEAFTRKNTSSQVKLRTQKSASSSALPTRAVIKAKIALSKQSVLLSRRALSKKLRKPIMISAEQGSSPALPSLLRQSIKSTTQVIQSSQNIKQEKHLIRSEVKRPILLMRSSTSYVDKIRASMGIDSTGQGEKFLKRGRYSEREDQEKV